MSVQRVIFEDGPGERRAAFFDADKLLEIWVEPVAHPDRMGEIIAARVCAQRRELGGGFVDIGAGSEAFLQATGRHPLPPEGAMVMVQLRRPAAAGKGPRVSQTIELLSAGLCLSNAAADVAVARSIGGPARRRQLRDLLAPLRPANTGWVVTAAGADIAPDTLSQSARKLAADWHDLEGKFVGTDRPTQLRAAPDFATRLAAYAGSATIDLDHDGRLFEQSGAEAGLAAALDRHVRLPGGATLVIDQAEALTAIDVNAAGAGIKATALDINLQAAAVIAAEIRLRAIAGMIVIDFLRLKDAASRQRVKNALAAALAADPAGCELLGWSRGGLFEVSRPRLRPSLQDQLCQTLPMHRPRADAAAHALLREILRAPAGHSGAGLICPPDIADYLATPPGQAALAMVQARSGEKILIDVIQNEGKQRAQVTWRRRA